MQKEKFKIHFYKEGNVINKDGKIRIGMKVRYQGQEVQRRVEGYLPPDSWKQGKVIGRSQECVEMRSIFEGLIQFRPSGVRVKKPDFFSTLVAMNHPQYIGPLKRRLSPDEFKFLQSFPDNFILHYNEKKALNQLGNAVNVKLVEMIIKSVFRNLNFQK